MGERLTDGHARLDYLVDQGILEERDDGTIDLTDSFEHRLGIYLDSYLDLPDEQFEATVAETFDLPIEEAPARIQEFGVTRTQLATYLALDAHLEDSSLTGEELGHLSALVADVAPSSAVPHGMIDATADPEAFIEEHGDAVVFVMRRACEPCEAMYADLDAIRAGAPERVSFAGVDGETATEFRKAYEVDVAPTTVVFAGGEHVTSLAGRQSPDDLAATFDEVYD